MPIGGLIMVGWFLLVVLTGAGLLVWGWRTGRVADWEQAKYVVLQEREPEPWTGGRKL